MQKLFWIFFLISGVAAAQKLDSVGVDTIEVEPPPYYLGVFLEGGMSFESSVPDYNFFSLLGIGVQYEGWILSFSRYDFQGTIQSFVIFPNTFELKYRYGGANIAYQFYQKKWLNLIVSGGYYKGDMVWRNMEDGQDLLRDEFDLIKLGLRGEIGKFRYIKPHVSFGYQKMKNLNLSMVNESDFSGLFIAAGIRIGYFNQ